MEDKKRDVAPSYKATIMLISLLEEKMVKGNLRHALSILRKTDDYREMSRVITFLQNADEKSLTEQDLPASVQQRRAAYSKLIEKGVQKEIASEVLQSMSRRKISTYLVDEPEEVEEELEEVPAF